MSEIIAAKSGDQTLQATLDFEAGRWTAGDEPPEGDFPFVAHVEGKRYELYSDGTFNEVEGGLD
jgi:hypothetical protein